MPERGYTLTKQALEAVRRVVRGYEPQRYGGVAPRRIRHEKTPQGKGGGSTPVNLTARTDAYTYTGNVHGNGRHNSTTESDVTIKVGAIDSGETLPTSGDYAWFVAHEEKWDVAGTDTTLWTIQPEILR